MNLTIKYKKQRSCADDRRSFFVYPEINCKTYAIKQFEIISNNLKYSFSLGDNYCKIYQITIAKYCKW